MGACFRLDGRPFPKVRFPFQCFLKWPHVRSFVWAGASGWTAGGFQKSDFFLNCFENVLIFALSCQGALPAGRRSLPYSPSSSVGVCRRPAPSVVVHATDSRPDIVVSIDAEVEACGR